MHALALYACLSSRSGCVIQVVIIFNNRISDQIENALRFERFTRLWLDYKVKNEDTVCREDSSGQKNHRRKHGMSCCNKYLRLFGTGAINIAGLAIVTTTIPVFLCASKTYMEFVLNAAATIFIVELDDLKFNTTVKLITDEGDEKDKLLGDEEDQNSASL